MLKQDGYIEFCQSALNLYMYWYANFRTFEKRKTRVCDGKQSVPVSSLYCSKLSWSHRQIQDGRQQSLRKSDVTR